MGSKTELIAVVFSVLSVYLSIRKNIWCWITGNISVIAYFFIFFQTQLYMDMILQVVYFFQGIYGVLYWKNSNESIKIITLHRKVLFVYLIFILLGASSIGLMLSKFTNASLPYIDALATILSLTANLLLARKYIQNWIFWILADIIYIALFWYKDLYISSVIYFLFLTLSILGYIKWEKQLSIKGGLS